MKPVSEPVVRSQWFAADCRRCERLSGHLEAVRLSYPGYHAAPVPPFGDPQAALLVVGLAPGLHGANATGRPFTGDYAGILLYQTLHRHGFSDRPESRSADDGLRLVNCRITNAVKCLPPGNKPTGIEVKTCNPFLHAELEALAEGGVVLALGLVAHNAVLRALGLKQGSRKFGHGAEYALPGGRRLIDSYHCSRYNTQTRRLTAEMFQAVVARARALVDNPRDA
jgi:uracil-DNA glycosylase family 4